MHCRPDEISLTVCDNGKGFDPVNIREQKGLGLLGAGERANLCDGNLDITSSPGQGTTLHLILPVTEIESTEEAE